MSNKLAIALGLLVVLAGATLMLSKSRQSEDQQANTEGVVLPSVDKDTIDRLEVAAPGKPPVTLVKAGEGWQLESPAAGAEAAQTALDTALTKLSELEVGAVAATKATNHERLEVTEDKAIHIVAKQGDTTVADLLVGAYVSGNTMVRQAGQDAVAAVRGSIRFAFDKDVKEWRNRSMLELDTSAVQALTLATADQTLKFVRDGEAFKQVEAKKPIKDFDPGKVKSLVSSLASLRAADFPKDGTTEETMGLATPAVTATLELNSDAGPNQVVLTVGNKNAPTTHRFARIAGNDTTYVMAAFVAERLLKGEKGFVKEPAQPPPASAAGPQGLPPGMQLPPGMKLPPGMQMPAGHP